MFGSIDRSIDMLSLASALASASASASAYSWSKLRSLDLSESRSLNGPRLKLLCDGLASPTCRLESLRSVRLSFCPLKDDFREVSPFVFTLQLDAGVCSDDSDAAETH